MDDTFSDCEVYCNQMLRRKRGFPLYVPEPPRNLPAEYRKAASKSTILLTTTMFLKISIHYHGTILKRCVRMSYADRSCVSTSSVESLNLDHLLRGLLSCSISWITFSTVRPRKELYWPSRWRNLKKLENLELVRAYVAEMPRNGINISTVQEDADSQTGRCTFVRKGFQLALKQRGPSWMPDSGLKYQWSGVPRNPAQTKCTDPFGPWNQTTFIHGLSISLGTGIWGRLFGNVEIREIMESHWEAQARILCHAPGIILVFMVSRFWGWGSSAWWQHHAGEAAASFYRIFPHFQDLPSWRTNQYYILQKLTEAMQAPHATVVMSHDDDWGDILRDDPSTGLKIQNVSEFLQRIDDQFHIKERDESGATFLESSAFDIASTSEDIPVFTYSPVSSDVPTNTPYSLPSLADTMPSSQYQSWTSPYLSTPHTTTNDPWNSGTAYPSQSSSASNQGPDLGGVIKQCSNCGTTSTPLW
ncbi:hypothetical protein B0H13DRAFT_2281059, partial [Mycena leptocephala]